MIMLLLILVLGILSGIASIVWGLILILPKLAVIAAVIWLLGHLFVKWTDK